MLLILTDDGTKKSQAVPAAPTNLVATPGNMQVSLVWNAVSGATSYNIYRGTSSGGETLLASGVGTNAYTDSTAANGTTYYYEVTAVNNAGESSKSNEVNVKPMPVKAGWWIASSLSLSDGSSVTSWSDSSGNGNTITTASGTPVFKVNIITGQPVVRLPTSSFMSGATPVNGNNPFTMFTVWTPAGHATNDSFDLGRPGVDSAYIGSSNGFNNAQIRANNQDINGGTYTIGTPFLASIVIEPGIANGSSIWVNGANKSSGLTNQNITSGSCYVGGENGSGFDVAEIRIYSSALSDSDRQAVEAELNALYHLY